MEFARNGAGSRLLSAAGTVWRGVTALAIFALARLVGATGDAGLAAAPLGAPGGSGGATMFVQLSPERTGIRTENHYDDPRMWADLYQEFEGGSVGTGVAIGDYDGDGRPDIFVVSKTESCRLFRNLGDWKFEDATAHAGVEDAGAAARVWKSGATFVDVNNDGRLDLYVCRFDAPNLLYVNQGDGTFKEVAHACGLDVRDASVMAAFCDYDRDGWLDVYIATNMLNAAAHPNGQRGRLLHNNGNGTFTEVTGAAGIAGEAQSHSATWWDYDNDGWPDLYVANDYGAPDRLYHNNRDGTFTDAINRALPHTAHFSMGADLGDVNNDGRIDFLVADMAATSHYKDQHSIAEARGKMADLPNPELAPKYMRSALLLNTGTGRCLEAAYLAGIAATDWTWAPRFEDLDNDGRLDYYVTNGFNRDPSPDMHERSMRAESTAERIRILRNSPILPETHWAFRNRGDLQFEDVSAAWGLDQKGVSFGAAFGDLDGDGDLDLVYSNFQAGVTVLRNECATGHRVMIDLRGTVSNRFGVGAVVRIESASGVQASQLVLARGYLSSSEPAIHFGLGDDPVIRRLVVTWPSGHVQTFENVPVDQRLTITEPAGPAPAPQAAPPARQAAGQFVEVGQGTELAMRSREEPVNELELQPLLPERLNRRGPGVAVGEDNGRTLIVIGGTTVTPPRMVRGTEANHFVATDFAGNGASLPMDGGPVVVLDVDGDGREDVVATMGGNGLPAGMPLYQPKVYLNDGNG
ncbi:MAG TPA: CRTAC1 family protein, partial [Opitutus sp.]|nr:CRTAC1 family protein [Opitutus sp.]